MDTAAGSATVLQDMDTVMQSNEVPISNGHPTNGFLDPRVLHKMDDLDLPDSDEVSREDSVESSSNLDVAQPRKAYLPTGCCYDVRMKLHANADFSASPHHPEDPRRIESIMKEFRDAGLIYNGSKAALLEILKDCPQKFMYRIDARKATESEICTVHTAEHFDWVHSLSNMSSAELRDLTNEFDMGRKSLYVGNLTYEAALISAGGAIETCKAVVTGNVKNAVAVIRPPGHHAEHNESLGFCIFNNVPIAATVCMTEYPEICRKILILDWDVHHGNGIQNMFYENPNVLYISLHVYQNGIFYPGQPENENFDDGGLDKVGRGKGIGRNVNIGWADQGVGDGEYMAAFQRIVMPIAQEFDPDLVIISAGFDAAAGDDLGGCFVSPACYSHMTHMLMSLANGKVAVCLEGGYNLRAISRSALAVAKTLMGEPPERISLPPLNRISNDTLNHVKRIQANYWECMRPGVIPQADISARATERMSDVIRRAQKSVLSDEYNMRPLKIMRTGITELFENQVLATPELGKAKKVIVFIHDPPDVLAQPDLHDNTIYPNNAYVTDELKSYIDWAITNNFGVIDINFPQQVTEPQSNNLDGYLPKANESVLANQTKELLCYVWDNWLETIAGASVTLVGVGDAYLGIKQLLTSRDTARAKIPSILSFVSGSLRTVKSDSDPQLSAWYRTNSLIYVSPDHLCFTDPDQARKVSKNRFGRVERADISINHPSSSPNHGQDGSIGSGSGSGVGGGGAVNGGVVGKMLRRHEEDGQEWISRKVREWEEVNLDPDETEDEDEKIVRAMEDTEMEMRGVITGEVSSRMPIIAS
ncbi:related to histone deacetylase A [Phialocephala subalpina]|uniref:Histone deacetylase n=1 Tax=Phialocephala subalpina TaxID=576137 RepID=A0A1L7WLK3_9HELO|nr:related to histone deacetylase A [Phialocephala subalpina]